MKTLIFYFCYGAFRLTDWLRDRFAYGVARFGSPEQLVSLLLKKLARDLAQVPVLPPAPPTDPAFLQPPSDGVN